MDQGVQFYTASENGEEAPVILDHCRQCGTDTLSSANGVTPENDLANLPEHSEACLKS